MKTALCLITGPAVTALVLAAVGSLPVALLVAGAACYLVATSDQ